MISISGGVALYDTWLQTFRAEVNGVIFGDYSNEFTTVESLQAVINCLTENDIEMLNKEKAIADGTYTEE